MCQRAGSRRSSSAWRQGLLLKPNQIGRERGRMLRPRRAPGSVHRFPIGSTRDSLESLVEDPTGFRSGKSGRTRSGGAGARTAADDRVLGRPEGAGDFPEEWWMRPGTILPPRAKRPTSHAVRVNPRAAPRPRPPVRPDVQEALPVVSRSSARSGSLGRRSWADQETSK